MLTPWTSAALEKQLRTGDELNLRDDMVAAEDLRTAILALHRDDWDPRGLRVIGGTIEGPLELRNTELPALSFEGTRFHGALMLSNATVNGRLRLHRCKLDDPPIPDDADQAGALPGSSAEPGGLRCAGLTTAGLLSLDEVASAGWVDLSAANVRSLQLSSVSIHGRDRNVRSLVAQNLSVRTDVFVDQGFASDGTVSFAGAKIGGQLALESGTISGSTPSGLGLDLEDAVIGDSLRLGVGSGTDVTGCWEVRAAVGMAGAEVGGVLIVGKGSATRLPTRPRLYAFDAQNTVISGNVEFTDSGNDISDDGFMVEGIANFTGSQIKGNLDVSGLTVLGGLDESVRMLNDTADVAEPVKVGLLARGMSVQGVLSLSAATIENASVTIEDATLGSLAVGDRAPTEKSHWRRQRSEGPSSAATSLLARGATIRRLTLADDPLPLGQAEGWSLGSVEESGAFVNRRAVTRWLSQIPGAQPWQELAAAYARCGRTDDANWLCYQSATRSMRKVKPTRPLAWVKSRTYWATTGLGYHPFRTMYWLAALLVTAMAITWRMADRFTTPMTDAIRTASPGLSSATAAHWVASWHTPQFEPLLYAAKVALPFASPALDTGDWTPPQEPWLVAAYVIISGLSWVLAALFGVGITGLLRRSS